MAGALTPHLTDSNYDEHSEDEDDEDVEKRVACQKSGGYNDWIYIYYILYYIILYHIILYVSYIS